MISIECCVPFMRVLWGELLKQEGEIENETKD